MGDRISDREDLRAWSPNHEGGRKDSDRCAPRIRTPAVLRNHLFDPSITRPRTKIRPLTHMGGAHRVRRERVVRLAHVVSVRVQTKRWDGEGEGSRMYAVEDQRKACVCLYSGRQALRVLSLIREHEVTGQSILRAPEDRLLTHICSKIVPATSCALRISTSAGPSDRQEDETRTRTRSSSPPPTVSRRRGQRAGPRARFPALSSPARPRCARCATNSERELAAGRRSRYVPGRRPGTRMMATSGEPLAHGAPHADVPR
jgi:hypothetical protein